MVTFPFQAVDCFDSIKLFSSFGQQDSKENEEGKSGYLSEGVVSYSIPQGMVRGSTLELMDHTFDGHEDSLSGDLRNGLGQLVDGRYGGDNFR